MTTTPKTLPEFGDYVTIEQKRFGVPNEFYIHKVVGCLESNSWIDVPAIVHNGPTLHDTTEPVVNVICCGICEETVLRYRVADVKIVKRRAAQPLAVAAIPEPRTFDQWWNEIENFAIRGERLCELLNKPSLAQVAYDEGLAAIEAHVRATMGKAGFDPSATSWSGGVEEMAHVIAAASPPPAPQREPLTEKIPLKVDQLISHARRLQGFANRLNTTNALLAKEVRDVAYEVENTAQGIYDSLADHGIKEGS